MIITNITESKPTQEDTLSLIKAIESDFSEVEQVLIKADWVMQHAVQQLQDNQLCNETRTLLIKQLNATLSSVKKQLYGSEQQSTCCDSNVA